jgi:hypothetical protein
MVLHRVLYGELLVSSLGLCFPLLSFSVCLVSSVVCFLSLLLFVAS